MITIEYISNIVLYIVVIILLIIAYLHSNYLYKIIDEIKTIKLIEKKMNIMQNMYNKNKNNLNNHHLEFNLLVKQIENYYDFFLEFNYDRKLFESIFYISNMDKNKLLLFFPDDNNYIYDNILIKYFGKYHCKKHNDFFPLPIKKIDKNVSNDLLFKYSLKNNNIQSLIDVIKKETTNYILINELKENYTIHKSRLLNETDIEYNIKICRLIKTYFDELYLSYLKLKYSGIKFENI